VEEKRKKSLVSTLHTRSENKSKDSDDPVGESMKKKK